MRFPTSLYPKKGFLKDYLDYAMALTDAPEAFHFFVGLGVLSTAIGLRIYFPFGASNIYPNLWTVLLAPSSFYRKSYCVTIGRNILDNFDEHLIMADEFSPEHLFERLQDKPQGIMIWSEFGNTLANFDKSYMLGTKEFLADIYDCPPKRIRRLKSKEFIIRRPCITILTCSTPEWFRNKVKEEDVRGGFFNRFIYVPPAPKSKIMAIPPGPNKALEDSLIKQLHEIKKIEGQAVMAPISERVYKEWYRDYEGKLHAEKEQDILSGFWTRLSIYTLKFAILFQISDDGSLEIGSAAMSNAFALTGFLKGCLKEVFEESLVFSREMREKNKVEKLINREPGIVRSKLLSNSHLSAKKLDFHLNTLYQEEKIVSRQSGNTTCYWPKKLARLAQISQNPC